MNVLPHRLSARALAATAGALFAVAGLAACGEGSPDQSGESESDSRSDPEDLAALFGEAAQRQPQEGRFPVCGWLDTSGRDYGVEPRETSAGAGVKIDDFNYPGWVGFGSCLYQDGSQQSSSPSATYQLNVWGTRKAGATYRAILEQVSIADDFNPEAIEFGDEALVSSRFPAGTDPGTTVTCLARSGPYVVAVAFRDAGSGTFDAAAMEQQVLEDCQAAIESSETAQ